MIAAAARFLEPLPYPATWSSTRRPGSSEPAYALRQAGLPPLRRRPGGGAAVARPGSSSTRWTCPLDAALNRRYGERFPVVILDGEELFEYFVDPVVLRERLDRVDA